MPRSQNKVASHRRRKRILANAKGYWGARSKVLTIAKHHIDKGLQYAYRDRKTKKRTFRQLWITRINAAARINGLSYSTLISGLKRAHIDVNRKLLADLAVRDVAAFAKLAEVAKSAA
jgi:large subunit ribosomal protein L20